MAENSKIEWTDHTFNPWIGCTRVSPGCVNCYAEAMNNHRGWTEWGPKGARKRTSDANWRKPLAWNRAAEKAGKRARVFCASLADVFDPHPSILPEWRVGLWRLIEATPWLDWQLLTKRPELVPDMVPWAWVSDAFPPNVWLGTSVEDQRRAYERIPRLLDINASVRFLSCEPLLDRVDLDEWLVEAGVDPYDGTPYERPLDDLDWVIVGGESGPGARPTGMGYIRDIVVQCQGAGVPVFVKQVGAHVLSGGSMPTRPRDAKGGDWSEWPADLRVREMPLDALYEDWIGKARALTTEPKP
jgi:protein gp37